MDQGRITLDFFFKVNLLFLFFLSTTDVESVEIRAWVSIIVAIDVNYRSIRYTCKSTNSELLLGLTSSNFL